MGRKLETVPLGDGWAQGATHLPQAAHLWHRTSYAGLQIIQVVQSRKAPPQKNHCLVLPFCHSATPVLEPWIDFAVDSFQRLSKLPTAGKSCRQLETEVRAVAVAEKLKLWAKVWSRFWVRFCSWFWSWIWPKILNLKFGLNLETTIWSKFLSWSLVEIRILS